MVQCRKDDLLVNGERDGRNIHHRRVARSCMFGFDCMNDVTMPYIFDHNINESMNKVQSSRIQLTINLISRLNFRDRHHRLGELQMWVRLLIELLCLTNAASGERRRIEIRIPIFQFQGGRKRVPGTEKGAQEDVG